MHGAPPHTCVQNIPRHICPGAQRMSQPPQLFGSLLSFTHVPPQFV
jgi:hypothetical protein